MEFNIKNITEEQFSDAIEGAWEKLNNEEKISIRQSYINYLAAQDGLTEIIESLKVIKDKKVETVQQVVGTGEKAPVEQPEKQPEIDEPEEEPVEQLPIDPQTNEEIDLDEEP